MACPILFCRSLILLKSPGRIWEAYPANAVIRFNTGFRPIAEPISRGDLSTEISRFGMILCFLYEYIGRQIGALEFLVACQLRWAAVMNTPLSVKGALNLDLRL